MNQIYYLDKHDTLPEIWQRCSPHDIAAICDNCLGWHDLASRLRKDAAFYDDFVSDGCTMWPDKWHGKNLRPACIKHDIRYYIGGSKDERFIADCYLAIDVCKIAGKKAAMEMLVGVRIGGGGDMKYIPWRWGFGRKKD